MTEHREPVAIIAIGNTLRRDDGVGPLLLDACRYAPLANCDLVEFDGHVPNLVEAWRDRSLAIVVDALCVGDDAGTLHDLEFDGLESTEAEHQAISAYARDLADALRLGRQLGELPQALRLFGIEPGDLKPGFGLSPPVEAAMADLESRVRSAVLACTQSSGAS